jgi:hypothetical protein
MYDSLSYISEPVPLSADFTLRGERLLDFQSSDRGGRFSIAIPGLPPGAILDDGFIALYGGLSTAYRGDSRASGSVNGGWDWNVSLDYNRATAVMGSYVAGPYSILDYTGAGMLNCTWDLTYGWPGTDLTAFGGPFGPQTEVTENVSVQFRVKADIAVNYHVASVPEPTSLGFSLAGMGLIVGGNHFAKIRKFRGVTPTLSPTFSPNSR